MKNTHLKKLKKQLKFLLPLGLGIIVLFFIFLNKSEKITPPTLPFDESIFQGLISVNDERFFSFTDEEIKDNRGASKYDDATRQKGGLIRYYYSEDEISLQEIIESIEPISKNKFVFAYYDPQITNWYTYPKGPYKNTEEIEEDELRDFLIPSGKAFVLVSNYDFYTINLKHAEEKPSKELVDILSFHSGWNIFAVQDTEEIKEIYFSCENKILSVWSQFKENDFRQVSKTNPSLYGDFNLIWIYISDEDIPCRTYSVFTGGILLDPNSPTATNDNSSPNTALCDNPLPVCDTEGNFHSNICVLEENGKTLSLEYLATLDGNCVLPSPAQNSEMPENFCNPLVFEPVCDLDGNWYQNKCIGFLRNPNIVFSRTFLALEDEEICKGPESDTGSLGDDESPADNGGTTSGSSGGVAEEIVVDSTIQDLSSGSSGSVAEDIVVDGSIQDLSSGSSGSVAKEIVVDSTIQDLSSGSSGSHLSIPKRETCQKNDPVCSLNGFYFSNICELKASGFLPDTNNLYIPELLFSINGNLRCKPVQDEIIRKPYSPTEKIEDPISELDTSSWKCLETKCIYNSILSGNDLSGAIINCEIGHLNCFESSELSDFNNLTSFEYDYKLIDSILFNSEQNKCCNLED